MIVPTYRRPEALAVTLAALRRLDFPVDAHEVVVVDDGRDEGTRTAVELAARSPGAPIRYVAQENSGVATARNRGARLAQGALLVFLDDDMIVEPSHLRHHVAVQEEHGPCLANGHWEFTPEIRVALEKTPFGRFRLGVEDWVKGGIPMTPLGGNRLIPDQATACNLGIPRELFWELGGFDEDFPFAGYEDQEFSARATDHGLRLVYDHDIRLMHNDHRITLEQFCGRQEQGAHTAVYLAAKRPGTHADRPLIVENAPISRRDDLRLVVKKSVKRLLSTQPLLAAAHAGVALAERLRPTSPRLASAYWAICGLHIFRGVRQGLCEVGRGPSWQG